MYIHTYVCTSICILTLHSGDPRFRNSGGSVFPRIMARSFQHVLELLWLGGLLIATWRRIHLESWRTVGHCEWLKHGSKGSTQGLMALVVFWPLSEFILGVPKVASYRPLGLRTPKSSFA